MKKRSRKNPCGRHSSTKTRKSCKSNPRKSGLKRRGKKSLLGDCDKACDPALCRMLKPYLRKRLHRFLRRR